MNRICSIVITYNRKELLLENISAMLNQTYETDILIFDNHSSENTKEYLESNGIIFGDKILYYYNDENIGGAGGFSKAMELAYDKGYELLYLMDDDGKPFDNNTLKEIIDRYDELKDSNTIINSLVVYNDNKELSFNVFHGKDYKEIEKNGYIPNMIMPFNGTLISRDVITKIGYPKKEFFIRGDEREYVARAKKNNVNLYIASNSFYRHPKSKISKKRMIFKNVIWSDEAEWKKYYETRNSAYIYKKYYSKLKLYKFVSSMYIKNLYFNRKNINNFKKAIKDGINEDFSFKAHLELK